MKHVIILGLTVLALGSCKSAGLGPLDGRATGYVLNEYPDWPNHKVVVAASQEAWGITYGARSLESAIDRAIDSCTKYTVYTKVRPEDCLIYRLNDLEIPGKSRSEITDEDLRLAGDRRRSESASNRTQTAARPKAPTLGANASRGMRAHRATPPFRAFATNAYGGAWGTAWGRNSPEDAVRDAVERCEDFADSCQIYSIGGQIVYGESNTVIAAATRAYETRVFGDPDKKRKEAVDWRAAAAKLTGGVIESRLSGRSIDGETFAGLTFKATLEADGDLVIDFQHAGINDGDPLRREGEWRVDGDRFCRQSDSLNNGREICADVYDGADGYRTYIHADRYELRFSVQADAE